jgi:hypothetical protein
MTRRRLASVARCVAAVFAALCASSVVRADESEPSRELGPWEEVVFLPESGLSVLLERDPRGVLLDRATYVDLYRRARAARGDATESAPGPALRLLRCDVNGAVAGEQAKLRVQLSVACRGATRETLALRLGGAVTSAVLDGAPATLGADAKGGLTLSVRGAGLHEAVVDLVAPVVRTKGQRTVTIELPAAPASRWALDIPGRVTASAGEGLWRSERLSGPDRTRLVAFGAAKTLTATWHEGDQGTDLPPLVRANVRTLAEVGERSLDAAVLLRVECSRSPRDAFAVTLPADLSVLGVDGDGASLVPAGAAADGRAPFTLKFVEPFTGVRTVMLRASRALPGAGTSDLPVVDVSGAATVERLLAVRFKDGLRGFIEAGDGATRLDPAASQEGAVDALLRLEASATPRARSERPSVQLRADARVLLDLADDGPWLAASFLYQPRGDRLYGVDPMLPAGFLPETVEVSGDRAFLRGATPDGRLSLVFPGGVAAGGAVTVAVRGRWPVAGWTVEDAAERSAPLPRIDAGTTAETDGWLGVAAPPGAEAREEETTGLVPAAVSELRERAGFTADGLALGWKFRGGSPGGRLRVTRPAASVTAAVAVLAAPAEDHLSLEGTVAVAVQRSGIREVRIDVAPALGDLLRIDGADVAEKRRVPGEGRETWIVRFGRLVRDGTKLVLRAELPLKDGAASVPAVSVIGAARQESMVGVAAGGELDVKTESSGLRDADAADLAPMLGARAGGLLRAWKAERGATPTLSVRTTRLPPSPLPAAFADSVRLETVIGMDGIARTRLDARVRNADRQALDVTLPRGARLSSARVAGKAARPVRTAAGVLLVPIVPSAAPFDVAILYEEAMTEGASAASLEAPDLGIPGSRAIWTVFLPEGSVADVTGGEFSALPASPSDPLCVRVFDEFAGGWRITKGEYTFGAHGAPDAAAPTPAASPTPAAADQLKMREAAEEDGEGFDGDGKSEAEAKAPPRPQERIEARAAQRGLFGMDFHLIAAGPSVTTTRLGSTGVLDVAWRSAAARVTLAILAAIAAFVAALLARRVGIGAPTWTIVALAFLTAAPIVCGTVDTSAWDAAAAATLLYAALAFVRAVARKILGRGSPRAALVVLALVVSAADAARAGDAKAPAPVPDQVVVPYDPKRPETLRAPQRVFLPYARYIELWNAANPAERIESVAPPVVVAAAYSGKVEDRAFVVAARYEIDPVDGGVVALPPGASVDGVTLDGRAAAATTSGPGGAALVAVPKSGVGARAVLEATLRWPVTGPAPGGSLHAPIPRAPRSTLVLDVPVADAVVTLGAAGGWTSTTSGAATRVTADLGPLDAIDVSWQPRGADAAGGRTRFEVETEAAAWLRPGLVEWNADVVLRVLAGTVQEFDASLPAGFDVQSVGGPAVASWTLADGGALRVRLTGAGPGDTKIAVVGVQRLADARASVVVPELVVRGAAADRCRTSVAVDDGRLVVAETQGVERTDPAGGARAGAVAFRRVRAPSRIVVRVEPYAAELVVASRQHLHLGGDHSLLRAEFDLSPGPRGLFEARVALPAGWTLDEPAGAESFPETGAVRLVFDDAPRDARRVVLELRGPAAGAAPTPFPVLRVDGATRESADLLVSTSPGFAAAAVDAAGLDPTPADRFAAWAALDPTETRSLAWHDPRGGGAVSIRRDALQPTVRPTVVADLTVLDDRVIVDALVEWNVRGGVERVFRVDAPPGVDDAWVLGEGLREVRREKSGDRQRLTVTMQAASTGSVAFRVLYDLPVPAGGDVTVAGPEPVGGEGARAFLLLRALGESEVQIGAAPALETCDVSDLPLIPQGLDPLRVLRFLRARDVAWRLPLRLVAHAFGDLPEARIHLVEATTVADRDGSARTRVEVRLFNRARSFLPVTLPDGADLETVLVGGAPVRPVTRPGEPGVVQVPVRVQSLGEESQTVSLTFRSPAVAPGARFGTMDPRLPAFPGVPVDATTWRLFLPADRDYSFSGNMDSVEETEVAIARAEAYASDNARLRTVLSKGSKQQQAVAAQNLAENTAELRKSLDVANSKMAELEQRATEGRVDVARLAETRRKAKDLEREIEASLADVHKADIVDRGAVPGVQRAAPLQGQEQWKREPSQAEERFATKEGQIEKKWATNVANALPQPPKQAPSAFVSRRTQTMEKAKSDGKNADDATVAFKAHEDFDKSVLLRSAQGAQLRESGGGGGHATPGAASGTATGGPDAGAVNPEEVLVPDSRQPSDAPPPELSGAAAGDDANVVRPVTFAGVFAFGGGGGGGGSRTVGYRNAPGVVGVISLAPPLVTEGRPYAFRKLDASAVVTVSARAQNIGRRLAAAGVFAALVAAVWALRRRRARAARV